MPLRCSKYKPEYEPREGKRIALLNPEGCLAECASTLPHPTDEEALEAYRVMVLALRPDDWFAPAYRELAGMILRGLPLHQIYLYANLGAQAESSGRPATSIVAWAISS